MCAKHKPSQLGAQASTTITHKHKHPFRMTPIDYFLDLLERYTGDNEQEVFKIQRDKGFFHSAVPAPENFMIGIASVAEIQVCREALRNHIHMAHLLAVENDDEDEGVAVLKLRVSTGERKGSVYYHRVPAGTSNIAE